jgi:hypothetical protein
MITRLVLIQIVLTATTFFSQPVWSQAVRSQPQSNHVFFEIVGYDIDLGREMIPDPSIPPFDARIRCHGTENSIDIIFLPAGVVLPQNYTKSPVPGSPGWYGIIYASRDEYVWFVDIIRNEKCMARLFADPHGNYITASGLAGWGHAE